MPRRFKGFSFALIASFLLVLSASLPEGPAAGRGDVVVVGYQVDGSLLAVTLSNHSPAPRDGEVVLVVSLADGGLDQVVVRFSLNGGSTVTYVTSLDTDVTGAVEHGIQDGGEPM